MRQTLIALLMFLVSGCVLSSRPPDAEDFKGIESLEQLEGVYRDLGTSGPGEPTRRLSEFIWPQVAFADKPDRIEVRLVSKDTLRVRALGVDGSPMKEGRFVKGRDFDITGGRIVIESDNEVVGFKSGEPMLGVHTGGRVLGLDAAGNGAYVESDTAAGLVFLFLPFAMHSSSQVRFERLSK